MKMRLEFIPYRLESALTFFITEDAVQRYYNLKVNAYLSGTNLLIYHTANILADSILFLCIVFLSYLVFLIYNFTSIIPLDFHDGNILPICILGSLSTICFCHLLGLLIKHPLLAQGLFHLPLSYFFFFIFNFSEVPLFIFPTILYAYSVLKQFYVHLLFTQPSL